MPVKFVRTPDDPHNMIKVVYVPERSRTGRPNPKRPLGIPRRGSLQPVATREFVVGLDLGQASDYTAIVAVEPTPAGYEVPFIARTRGRSYPEIVGRVRDLMTMAPFAGASQLVVDGTGVGRPVLDMLRDTDLDPIAVMIHGGAKVSGGRRLMRVPKGDLISALLVAFQANTIKISAELEHAQTLARELVNMRRRISAAGTAQYGVWREGEHDDLVLALALAVWFAERTPRKMQIVRPATEPPRRAREVRLPDELTPDDVLDRIEQRKAQSAKSRG